jgi:hypothetical protein
MEPNLAVSIYVRSSIKFLISFRSTNKYGRQGQFLFLIGYCLKKIFSSETVWQNETKLGRKHLCKILYKASSFGSIQPTNMAAKINSFFLIG